jgi:membrane protein implicated in regulation of membrane protease activity
MMPWLESLSTLEKVFFAAAAVGGGLFAIRLVMAFVGMGGGEDGGGDTDHGGADADHSGADGDGTADHGDGTTVHDMMSFKLLSFQGLTGFFMMFGLVGLAMSRGQSGAFAALAAGTVAGLAIVWVVDRLFRLFSNMQSAGNVSLRQAIGQDGTVYLKIPAGEIGKVRVMVQGYLKVLDATAEDKSEILSDARIKVTNITDGNVLIVKKL